MASGSQRSSKRSEVSEGTERRYPSKGARVGGRTAGAGGGTLLVLLANTMDAKNPLKPWILAAAPSITVGLTAILSWGLGPTLDFIKKQRFRRTVSRARHRAEKELQRDSISAEEKEMLEGHLIFLQKTELSNEIQLIQQLTPLAEVTEFASYAKQGLGDSQDNAQGSKGVRAK